MTQLPLLTARFRIAEQLPSALRLKERERDWCWCEGVEGVEEQLLLGSPQSSAISPPATAYSCLLSPGTVPITHGSACLAVGDGKSSRRFASRRPTSRMARPLAALKGLETTGIRDGSPSQRFASRRSCQTHRSLDVVSYAVVLPDLPP